ncbi:MAG: spermidine/putrescine transport system substrate-binding protein [Chloroflexota bacterium]|nr:spermidine/putrescine transport system substrate-binding protein [Chloroflexota bacterium]
MNDRDDRQVINPDLTRRRFLQGSALAGVAAFLAACTGSSGTNAPSAAGSDNANIPTPPPAPSATPVASPTPQPSPTGPLHWAQWPAYIDLSGKAGDAGVYAPGSSPTIEDFKKKYGVDVDYEEKIEDNKVFYATIQPQLQAGASTNWDMITITDWLAAKIISKSWAEKIDQGNVPNCTANLRDALKNQVWDPSNDYHYPWQSGMTGIGYNKNVLKTAGKAEPKSLVDLYALPANRVSFLTEARDTFGLGLLKLGIDPNPQAITADNLQAVHDDIKPLVDKGLIFADNSYLKNFAAKKTWAAMVWSGDLASSGTEGDTFVVPTEGAMIWTDNMVIPKGATNKFTAELMMNYVYDPKIAAQIENYVYYVSPVNGAKAELEALNQAAPLDQYHLDLLFPPDDVVAKQKNFQFLSTDLETKMDELFLDLSGA